VRLRLILLFVVSRELIVLGTASQVPTRQRSHNGYLLRWDGLGVLFDPGEGAQRQLGLAGLAVHDFRHICLTHFHGDHCLGLPGIVQRLSLDRVPHPVHVHYPASGQQYFDRLRHATPFHEVAELRPDPVAADGVLARGAFGALETRRLDHPVEAFGYRLVEPDGVRMRAERLAALGVRGPDVGRLQRAGSIRVGGRTVTVAEVSEPRPGQRCAFVMDTRLCDGVYALAERADLLVIESTFLSADADLAAAYGHLTARQAGQVAAESGVGTLLLTHFSRRYPDADRFRADAAEAFDGTIVVAEDLLRVPLPPRRR
jgi:ribonuclease Z